jgi:exopolysaccharide biosynthesis polyprenyl glycosylphosphotransferase
MVIYVAMLFCFVFWSASTWTQATLRTAMVSFWSPGFFGYSLGYTIFLVLSLKHYCYYISLPVNSLFSELVLVLKSLLLSLMVLLSTFYVFRLTTGTKWLICNLLLNATYLVGARMMRSSDLERGIADGWLARNALIVGTGEVAHALATHLESNPKLGYVVKGFLSDRDDDPRLVGSHADLYRVIQTHFIDEVFITTPMHRDLVKKLTLEAPELHVNVSVVPDLYDGIGWHTPVSRVGSFPVMSLHREEVHGFQLRVKRLFDIVCAFLGLLLASPLIVALAIVIKLDSPGPVFYRARRVGKKGTFFDCYKFRSMQMDADKLIDGLAHLNEREGPLFKISNDPRVTRLGRFLRRYSIDELPQLLNVLKGEMSLVGPRPPALQEYLQYQVEHLRKLEVIPGITGLWQISARQDPSFDSYIKYDLEYIENWSLWLDLKILIRTILVVLSGTGN